MLERITTSDRTGDWTRRRSLYPKPYLTVQRDRWPRLRLFIRRIRGRA